MISCRSGRVFEARHYHPWCEVMDFVFPDQAIELLRSCVYDPRSTPMYEMISGGVNWDDEQYLELAALCRHLGCRDCGALFAYRTSLLMARPLEEYRYAWDEVRERCPEWIGFRPERVTPTAELQAFIRDSQDDY